MEKLCLLYGLVTSKKVQKLRDPIKITVWINIGQFQHSMKGLAIIYLERLLFFLYKFFFTSLCTYITDINKKIKIYFCVCYKFIVTPELVHLLQGANA